ncbi:sigma-54-dependent transcriptional regulator [Parachitinimonas caeni]|uniref:Sigma-54 dependent transcriptional regulator n=1 Tax=Parachitinimonas caeni TaxID=3031301 RepID=A0ABT7DY18_9NEIS|nr:sigma-54 dependent transcriptional regulator [Parachitinimonas caeni]MDK2124931.1 sigma-54 dependent transcriptional regulator [Parachitinimonas caeni]
MTAPAILILDDDPDVACAARLLLRRRFGEVHELHHPRQLFDRLDELQPAVLLLDLNFTPGRADGEEGLALLRQLSLRPQRPAVIVMTAYADVPLAVEAVKLGAFDFVTKPWDNPKLIATVGAALALAQPAKSPADHALLGESAPMNALRQLISSVAPTDASVLILGENGVGKELVARALHQASHRAAQTLLAVDMGALPASTFESELFGHKKGSFTDARSDRQGRFQAAQGGTLFLDEIGNMPLAGQAKLLTALERREVTPIGADRPEPIDVRIISATNLAEAQLFDPAYFRADLLYRLNTIVLRVPPLRDRREDIPLLLNHYLGQYAAQYGKPGKAVSTAALMALHTFDWPGNVRSLRHACERAVILGNLPQYEVIDFGLPIIHASPGSQPAPSANGDDLRLAMREKDAIHTALQQAEGNISEAARRLGISRAALYRKLEKHGL